MGNGFAKQLRRRLGHCFTKSGGEISGRHEDATAVMMMIPSEVGLGLGHSFCYIRPDPFRSDSSSISSSARTTATTFSSISGASISANNSTPLSTSLNDSSALDKASAFDSSGQFFSVPLQPVPKSLHLSGGGGSSGNLTAGSGPNPLGFLSGPIQRQLYFSGNLDHKTSDDQFLRRSFSQEFSDQSQEQQQKKQNFVKKFKRAIARTVTRPRSITREVPEPKNKMDGVGFSGEFSGEFNGTIQWAQGKAGEDRMQVVISEESGWVFVGIYDGFSGPDAPDFLISNLYSNVYKELEVEGVLDQGNNEIDHSGVLHALSLGLEKTEAGFLDEADKLVTENPELALMGSCVLVMVMKGDDVYLMNVGDSRAVLAHKVADPDPDTDTDIVDNCRDEFTALTSLQLTKDHSTYIQEEVERIKKEHPDDAYAIMNDRVKGYLKVTRAFGAGFLKQPKWNDALLEMFQIDFIGTFPYITCVPSLRHHKLGPSDRFLILCSDGLNQYFTNQEAVSSVESFLDSFPEGDPAQHLIEQVLFRAARKAGMDFHELLDIPQGDRRRYHDDVSVIIISLEGRIWRSSM